MLLMSKRNIVIGRYSNISKQNKTISRLVSHLAEIMHLASNLVCRTHLSHFQFVANMNVFEHISHTSCDNWHRDKCAHTMHYYTILHEELMSISILTRQTNIIIII
jgi:hypothetical protein